MQIDSKKHGFGQVSRNLHIGDIKKADTLICVPYDTASKILWRKSQYYPLNTKKNLRIEMKNTVIHYSLAVVSLGFYYLIHRNFLLDTTLVWNVMASFIAAVIIYKFIVGFANKYNFIRNTASIVILMKMIRSLKKQRGVAYVLMDRTSNSYEGFKQLNAALGSQASRKTMFILDCIAADESIFFHCHGSKNEAWRKEMEECYKGIKTEYVELSEEDALDTPLELFSKAIYITGGTCVNGEVVVSNTRGRGDCSVDFDKMNAFYQGLYSYIAKEH